MNENHVAPLVPSDDSHMLADSPVGPQTTSKVSSLTSAATATQRRGTDGFQSARTNKAGPEEGEEEEEEEEASMAALLSRGLAERKSHLCEGKKFVFLRVGHCVRKGGGRKNRDTVQEGP